MKTAKKFQNEYDELKADIITYIWFCIKDRNDSSLDIMETKGIPAIVTQSFDDQVSETIDELIVKEAKVIAIASSLYDDVKEYNLDDFEVPFLIQIFDSVEKHLMLEATQDWGL